MKHISHSTKIGHELLLEIIIRLLHIRLYFFFYVELNSNALNTLLSPNPSHRDFVWVKYF